jgi:hypothetical protein
MKTPCLLKRELKRKKGKKRKEKESNKVEKKKTSGGGNASLYSEERGIRTGETVSVSTGLGSTSITLHTCPPLFLSVFSLPLFPPVSDSFVSSPIPLYKRLRGRGAMAGKEILHKMKVRLLNSSYHLLLSPGCRSLFTICLICNMFSLSFFLGSNCICIRFNHDPFL